jgi:glycosyltransferase involved in cell wall biosynthesis
LLRTWIRATEQGDDAVLVVKSTSFVSADRLEFEQDLRTMQERLGRSLEDAAPVVMLERALDDGGVRSLYAAATHYISMSFGEGWDLAMIEAACAGLNLIAPRHSGYLGYLGEDDALWLPARLEPASFEGNSGRVDERFFRGTQWWRPEEDAAVEVVRRAIRGEQAKQSPQERIVREFTWERAARKLVDVLEPLAPRK